MTGGAGNTEAGGRRPKALQGTKPREVARWATAAKLRWWRVAVLRTRAKHLGDVQAPDEETAAAAVVAEFKLTDDQRRRLVVQERNE
jgi:hypothetical protein